MVFIRSFIFFVLAFTSHRVYSQEKNIHFNHLGIKDGLSQSDVQAIVKDKYGFMWFGTQDGLNKYDGYKFTLYKNNPKDPSSLRSNIVNAVYEDKMGNLWVGTTGGGLSLFNRNTNSFVHYNENPTDPTSISNNAVTSILEDSYGMLWIGTYWNLNTFNRKTKKFTRFVHSSSNPQTLSSNVILSLAEDSKGNIWIGTDQGLNLFERQTKTFKRFVTDPARPNGIRGNQVRAIVEDINKNLWVGTDQALELFDHSSETFTHFVKSQSFLPNPSNIIDNVVYCVADGKDGTIWIGTENGLDLFNPQTKLFTHYTYNWINENSIRNNSVNTIFLDPTGILWVGTFAGGVSKYDRNLSRFRHYIKNNTNPNSLNHNIVTSFEENDAGEIWIGTDGGGLNLFNKKTDQFKLYNHDPTGKNGISSNTILDLLIDRDKNLWIATYDRGLDLLNTKTNTFRNFKKGEGKSDLTNNSVFALLEDRHGNIYIGLNEGGLNILDTRTQTITRYRHNSEDPHSLVNDDIRVLLEDSDGIIWIGTYSGLSCFDPVQKTFTNYSEINSNLVGHAIFSIYEDHNKNIWIGTMGALNLFNKSTRQFIPFVEQNGLANGSIKYINEDSTGHLWLSTNKGITRFDVKNGDFYNYEVQHGIQGYEFFHGSGFRTKDGAILMGGINGFNLIDPRLMSPNKIVPEILITGFELFNNPVSVNAKGSPLTQHITETKEITLRHDQSVFTIEYTALGYTNPEKNSYAFMLEGFEKKWNYVGEQRTTTYTNLDPGEYIFRVKAANNDGFWTEKPASLRIIITPPYWKTWWFRVLMATAIVGSVFAYFRIRINRVNAAKLKLESQVTERTERLAMMTKEERNAREEAEQANRAKSIFLATMSHEIRTPMNGVIGTASLLAETELNAEQKRYAEIIRTSGENLLSVINDILDFSKIESGKMELEQHPFDIRVCIEEVLDLFAGKASESGIDLVYEMGSDVPEQISGDSTRVRQILINLVGNALKFTQSGEVYIGVRVEEIVNDEVRLTFEIRDTGIGIPADKIGRLFSAFMQVDSATTRKYGGSGLGLAICKRLVELMGGNISAESRLGQGTTFRFTILTSAAIGSVKNYVHCNVKELAGKRILIVDDNETNRYILNSQLLQWNFVPTVAASGGEALQLLSGLDEFDLVITDMKMPEMNGVELATAIKKDYPALPIFLLSSIGDERQMQYPLLFSSILSKPLKQQQLCKAIVMQFKQAVSREVDDSPLQKQKLSVDFAERFPMQILVAEDNPVNQLLAVMVLKKLGYDPHTAINGVKVLEAVIAQQYDLILMDVQMPEMDGLDATRLIRQQLAVQPVIIAATANAMHEDRETCMDAGMDDYISKPLELETLVQLLEKWAPQN